MRAVVIGAHRTRESIEPDSIAVPIGPLFLSGMSIAVDQPLGDRELLVSVAAMRARLLERGTFIAIRYGLAVQNEAEAMARCGAYVDRWARLLRENEGRVEATMKIVAEKAAPALDRRSFKDGASYLRAMHRAAQDVSIDEGFRLQAEKRLFPLVREHRWSRRDSRSMELAMLLDREAMPLLQGEGAVLRNAFPAVPFLLSGPWPLEVFAE